MCWFNCLKIAHYVPHIHARTTSFGNGACACVFMTIYSELRRERGCAACTDRYVNMFHWVCERAHLPLFSHMPLKECHRCTFISALWLFSKWVAVSELDDRPTHRRLFGMGGRPFRSPSQGLWRTWSLVLHPRLQWHWVPWHEGTCSIATFLIRDVTLWEKKTRVVDSFTFSVGFAQTSSGSSTWPE